MPIIIIVMFECSGDILCVLVAKYNILQFIYFGLEEFSTPACQILQKHSDRVSLHPLSDEIVQMLYKEKVISKETLDEVNRLGGVLGDSPLRALYTTVYEDRKKLATFATVLMKSEQTVPVANDILKEYGKYMYN